jgi:hypothetical protein
MFAPQKPGRQAAEVVQVVDVRPRAEDHQKPCLLRRREKPKQIQFVLEVVLLRIRFVELPGDVRLDGVETWRISRPGGLVMATTCFVPHDQQPPFSISTRWRVAPISTPHITPFSWSPHLRLSSSAVCPSNKTAACGSSGTNRRCNGKGRHL